MYHAVPPPCCSGFISKVSSQNEDAFKYGIVLRDRVYDLGCDSSMQRVQAVLSLLLGHMGYSSSQRPCTPIGAQDTDFTVWKVREDAEYFILDSWDIKQVIIMHRNAYQVLRDAMSPIKKGECGCLWLTVSVPVAPEMDYHVSHLFVSLLLEQRRRACASQCQVPRNVCSPPRGPGRRVRLSTMTRHPSGPRLSIPPTSPPDR